MKSKLVEPWWDWGLNPITGMQPASLANRGDSVTEEKKYANTLPTLDKNI